MGEKHKDIWLKQGMKIHSVGKLSLEDYAKVMLESRLGVSLMISPHPSYPPLEMSTFGVITLTNCFENKDMSYFNDNIISMKEYSAENIAYKLKELIKSNKIGYISYDKMYVRESDNYSDVADYILKSINYTDGQKTDHLV